MAPLGVAWSLLLGAAASWGLLYPVLDSKKGSWYADGLPSWDARGLFGYQLCMGLGFIMADGAWAVLKGAVLGALSLRGRDVIYGAAAPGGGKRAGGTASAAGGGVGVVGSPQRPPLGAAAASPSPPPAGGGSRAGMRARKASARRRWHAEALAALENDALSDASNLQFSLAAMERSLRQHVFMSDQMPGAAPACLAAALALLLASAFALPALLPTLAGLRGWVLLVPAVLAPAAALASARAAGVAGLSVAPYCATAALVLFAALGAHASGGAGGVATALVSAGIALGAAQSAAQMGYSFAAGYTALASPTAILAAHAVGCVGGALFAPLAYQLLVAVPDAQLSPLAAPARATAALFADGGLGALPAYAGWMGLAALVVGLMLAAAREVLGGGDGVGGGGGASGGGGRARMLVPIPVAVGAVFLAGANVAVGVALGSILRVVWRWRSPKGADAYAALVGGALIAGDGVWAVGRGLLGAFGVRAPICMTFSPAPAAAAATLAA